MYTSMFMSQFVMGLKLYIRRPAAMFWMMAFPVLMLLGLGTVFSESAEHKVKLVWSQNTIASADQPLQQALKELGMLVGTGKLKPRESIAQGIEAAPEAFLGLLKGKNFGKQIVKLI